MGIFSWLGNASELTSLMSRADAIVLQLTGNNPKHLHPTLYRHLLDNVKEKNDEAKFIDSPPLNEYEAALIMLTVLCAGTRQAESPNSLHRAEVYESAINHIRVKNGQQIRGAVSLWAFSVTG
jgi:hypothetical protein